MVNEWSAFWRRGKEAMLEKISAICLMAATGIVIFLFTVAFIKAILLILVSVYAWGLIIVAAFLYLFVYMMDEGKYDKRRS